jgi:opacity protein-like surface antigen
MTITGVTTVAASGNQTGNGYMLGLGYDFNVAKHVDIRAEYNHMERIAGISDNSADVFLIGVIGKF